MNGFSMRCLLGWLLLVAMPLRAEERTLQRIVIEPGLVHLRSGAEREWTDFPKTAQGRRLERSFKAATNTSEQTLLLRLQDVKQSWNVTLNGAKLATLPRDEYDEVIALTIPAGGLADGENTLVFESPATKSVLSDDVRIGQCAIVNAPPQTVLSEAAVEVRVLDASSSTPVPGRITVLDSDGAMQSVGAVSNDHLAVRPGTVYTSRGEARFGVPAGRYTIFAGRGFEYSLDRTEVSVAAGETAKITLTIRREVPTDGYVACDTHVHTLTHSGHGDSTLDERMITLAGEGIELPIATDHNKHISYEDAAVKMGVRSFFTPVIGNEVTTPRGHFNIFPIATGAKVVDHRQTDWKLLFDDIEQTPGVEVSILNHARDLHSGVRPFSPENHNALVGENVQGWPLRFNAMEVINSGATQTDPLQLCHDWMGLLNHGLNITPVGSSDSHDVSRLFVGQGRTYIRVDDRDPGRIDVDNSIASFRKGQVLVSYGLLTELTVNGRFRSGDLAKDLGDEIDVQVRVLGPHWVQATRILLYANGQVIREDEIPAKGESGLPSGVIWQGGWKIMAPPHDVHLVAIATGPGVEGWHWRTAKPYQPTTPNPETTIFGCSGAVWLDADGDERRNPARTYAERLVNDAAGDSAKLIRGLSTFDEAVAAQAAHLVGRAAGDRAWPAERMAEALKAGSSATQIGFEKYAAAWRENEIARVDRKLD